MDTDQPYDDLLPLLLGICEDFFTGAGPAVHHEVDAVLQARDITGGPGWLIDMLALTRQRLETPAGSGGTSARQTSNSHVGGAQTHRH
jgi:hypothetical protein